MDIEYQIKDHSIEYITYPFKCSVAYKHKVIDANSINEIAKNFHPPAILVNNNEFIFINIDDKNDLISFCSRNAIPVYSRCDVWSLILDHFLDTELSEENKERGYLQLSKCGISRQECNKIRQENEKLMFAYNYTSGLWEWIYLGLFDILCANVGYLSGPKHCLSDIEFKNLYCRAMDIALRGVLHNNCDDSA